MAEGITLKRIIDMDEATELSSSDYALVDSATGGPKKFALGEELSSLKEEINELSSIPTTVRQAMLTLFESAAYAETGLTDEIAVVESWAEEVTSLALDQTAISISGSGTVQLVATTVPAGKTVTWSSSDDTIATVSASGLVTGVSNGSVTITAACGDKRATCAATVSGFATLVSISAVYTQSGTVHETDTLDSLKSDLVVTAHMSDSTTRTVTEYTLSGTLTVGTSTITVAYGGKTTTFTVTVTSYWDYEWDSSSETLPSNMTAKSYDFTTEPGALYVREPNLDFDYIGDAEIEVVMKWYSDSSLPSSANNPQIVLKRGTKDGIKVYGGKTTDNKIFSNISGSTMATESYDNVYHTINIKGTGSSYVLKIDDETLTGSGVTNNNYLSFTGIVCNEINNHIFAAYIKSIKFHKG